MLSVQLLHFRKKRNADEDRKHLEDVVGYKLSNWRDKGFLQVRLS